MTTPTSLQRHALVWAALALSACTPEARPLWQSALAVLSMILALAATLGIGLRACAKPDEPVFTPRDTAGPCLSLEFEVPETEPMLEPRTLRTGPTDAPPDTAALLAKFGPRLPEDVLASLAPPEEEECAASSDALARRRDRG